jgi:hypothetical protein
MRFELDETKRAYNPQNPPPGRFWQSLANGTNWIGFLLLMTAVYAVPVVVILLLVG